MGARERFVATWVRPVVVVAVAALVTLQSTPALALVHLLPGRNLLDHRVAAVQDFASSRVLSAERNLPAGVFTRETLATGQWRHFPASVWTAGYLPGESWLEFERTGNVDWYRRAAARQTPLGAQASQPGFDYGVRFFYSYANGHRLIGDPAYRTVALKAAAQTAARYSPTQHMVRSRDATDGFQVVVDEMMNLQLLFWGARNGGPAAWRTYATEHALTVRREFVRPDGTTHHLIVFDEATAAVKEYRAGQGYAPDSTWSRGQAWAIYGFAAAYRETGDVRFLETARLVSDSYLAALPADKVPYWDFEAPGIPNEPRDSSAAAIAASGLLDLASTEPDTERRDRYVTAARAMIRSLGSAAYLTAGTTNAAVLAHGSYDKPSGRYDTGLAWGDYFFLESMLRLRLIPPATAPVPVTAASESGHLGSDVAARSVDGTTATGWTSYGRGQWLELDLGRVRRVSKVSLVTGSGLARSGRYTFLLSDDHVYWRTMGSAVSSGRWAGAETFDLPDARARYVRVVCTGTSDGLTNSILEAKVY